jgi:hypothetical protein
VPATLTKDSIKAAKKGRFQEMAYLTTKAALYHAELRKEPFTIYVWEHQISGIDSKVRPGETAEDFINGTTFTVPDSLEGTISPEAASFASRNNVGLIELDDLFD